MLHYEVKADINRPTMTRGDKLCAKCKLPLVQYILI